MARPAPLQSLIPSVMDRLFDPRHDPDPRRGRDYRLNQLKEDVRRDLEWLLNTRRVEPFWDDSLTQLDCSVYAYGLPDLSNYTVANIEDHRRLRRFIERAIDQFEPRLTLVEVEVAVDPDVHRILHFQINAMLLVEPDPEPVCYDSRLELPGHNFRVTSDGR